LPALTETGKQANYGLPAISNPGKQANYGLPAISNPGKQANYGLPAKSMNLGFQESLISPDHGDKLIVVVKRGNA